MIINDVQFTVELEDILVELVAQLRANNIPLIQKYKEGPTDFQICCPYHANGMERRPSAGIRKTDGLFHCFACGEKGTLAKLVGKCYDNDTKWGENWLIDNFSSTFVQNREYLEEIVEKKKEYLEESVLETFEYDNEQALDYLINKRHLHKDIIEKFQIGYEKSTNSVTFPCRDEHGRLVGVFKRNISTKFFTIPQIDPKPVYLLDYVIKNGYSKVYVVESQINALTLWGWGFPAVALFGTGSNYQYEVLNKSGIRQYILAFDGDLAGQVGANRFVANNKEALLTKVIIPQGKDVNDLTKEEFLNLEEIYC